MLIFTNKGATKYPAGWDLMHARKHHFDVFPAWFALPVGNAMASTKSTAPKLGEFSTLIIHEMKPSGKFSPEVAMAS